MAGDTGGDGGTGIDTTVPHSARIWNYWLGGKDNIIQVVPAVPGNPITTTEPSGLG